MDRPHNFNHLLFEGHLSYFHTVNKATVNNDAQVFLSVVIIFISLG